MQNSRLVLASAAVLSVAALLFLWITLTNRAELPQAQTSGTNQEPDTVNPGVLDPGSMAIERHGDPSNAPAGSEPIAGLDAQVVCQVVRAGAGRFPLSGVELIIQLDPPVIVDSFSEARSDNRGVASIRIPVSHPFTIYGFHEGSATRLDIPALSEQKYLELYPEGIELDFFLDPVQVSYSVLGNESIAGRIFFLTIASQPLDERIIPRDSDLTDVIRAPGRDASLSGTIVMQAGSEIYWALYDQFGIQFLSGSSGRIHAPNDRYLITIDLSEHEHAFITYFRVIEGLELFEGPYARSVQFQVFDELGNGYGSSEGIIDEAGAFALVLPPSRAVRLVLQHPRISAMEINIDESEGLTADQPISIRVRSPTRVFLSKIDFPDASGQRLTVVFKSGRWRSGVVIDVEGVPDTLEVIGGWNSEAHSFRLLDHLFLVNLSGEQEVRIPCPQIVEVPLGGVQECEVEVQAAAVLEQSVMLTFFVRDELWQIHRIYSPLRRKFTFSTRLPSEPGVVVIREGFRQPTVVPYTVDASNRITIRWINK